MQAAAVPAALEGRDPDLSEGGRHSPPGVDGNQKHPPGGGGSLGPLPSGLEGDGGDITPVPFESGGGGTD